MFVCVCVCVCVCVLCVVCVCVCVCVCGLEECRVGKECIAGWAAYD